MKECEKISLISPTWAALPDMREGRSHLNPCEWKKWIYLCGDGSTSLEAFTPQNDIFLPLSLRLESYGYCLYVHDDLLVVHSYECISKFEAGLEGQIAQRSQVATHTALYKHSNSQPVLDPARSFFFIMQEDKCLCFNMETGELMDSFA